MLKFTKWNFANFLRAMAGDEVQERIAPLQLNTDVVSFV